MKRSIQGLKSKIGQGVIFGNFNTRQKSLETLGAFVSAIENAREAILITSSDTKIIFANKAVYRLFGYKREELIGRTPSIFHKGQDSGLLLKKIFSAVRKKGFWEGEIESVTKQGKRILTLGRASCVRDKKGRIVNYLCAQHDVTERRRIEEDLRLKEERYLAILHGQADLISRFKPDGTFIFANDAYCSFFGKTEKQLVGKKWFPRAFSEDLPMIRRKLETLKPDHPEVVVENRVISASGEVHWMQFVNRAFYDPKGRHLETQSVGRDITSLKKMELELKSALEWLSLAQRHALIGAWDWDLRTNQVRWSDEYRLLFGHKLDAPATLRGWEKKIHPNDRAKVKAAVKKVLREKIPYNVEYRIKKTAQQIRWINGRGDLIFDDNGRPKRMVGLVIDITESRKIAEKLKRSEQELQKQKVLLEHKNIALQELIKQIEVEKDRLKKDVMANIEKVVLPILRRLGEKDGRNRNVGLIERQLGSITSELGGRAGEKFLSLAPREREISSLVKAGQSSKEIASTLKISVQTVEKHRRNIRKKLGLVQKKVNLTSFLE
ncbi:MAG TPA: PAS domain S-box protein [Candidatus Omnitrophota bacterium]|nr:PAS domain S-box protein [Candidatus Omnitrophota bacterium]